jgi:agmatinase
MRCLSFFKDLSNRAVVGMDLVEVSPPYDPSGITSILAAQVLMNAVGFIFYEKNCKKVNV